MRSVFVGILIALAALPLNAQQPSERSTIIGPGDVDAKSIKFVGSLEDTNFNVVFELVGKTSEDIRNIRNSHGVRIANERGVIVIDEMHCTGLRDKSAINYIGLVLVTTNYVQAKLAESTLRGESRRQDARE
jgi:hypothetical protein